MRKSARANDRIRPVTIEEEVLIHAHGSVLIGLGNTRVLCAVTVEEEVPPFLKDSGRGWITAEYGMLPAATHTRSPREAVRGRQGRTLEIQRFIGRSLRAMVDLALLGERTLRVDCDVIQADGGTRTAAVTGAALALRRALGRLAAAGRLPGEAEVRPLAAVSAGIVDGVAMLDLDYDEDSRAQVDANFVLTADGRFVEVQGAAEGRPFSEEEFLTLAGLARKGVDQLLTWWR